MFTLHKKSPSPPTKNGKLPNFPSTQSLIKLSTGSISLLHSEPSNESSKGKVLAQMDGEEVVMVTEVFRGFGVQEDGRRKGGSLWWIDSKNEKEIWTIWMTDATNEEIDSVNRYLVQLPSPAEGSSLNITPSDLFTSPSYSSRSFNRSNPPGYRNSLIFLDSETNEIISVLPFEADPINLNTSQLSSGDDNLPVIDDQNGVLLDFLEGSSFTATPVETRQNDNTQGNYGLISLSNIDWNWFNGWINSLFSINYWFNSVDSVNSTLTIESVVKGPTSYFSFPSISSPAALLPNLPVNRNTSIIYADDDGFYRKTFMVARGGFGRRGGF